MSSAKTGGTATRLAIEIGIYLKTNNLGRVYGTDTMFTIGNNERMSDVSLIFID